MKSRFPRWFLVLTESDVGVAWRWREWRVWKCERFYYDGNHWMLQLGPLCIGVSH